VPDNQLIPLAEMIQMLRLELKAARNASLGEEDVRFNLGPIELEFDIGVTKAGEGESGVKFWVLTLGAKGSYEKVQTQHIKLTLNPIGPDKADLNVNTYGELG
jgi:hypothetical protein